MSYLLFGALPFLLFVGQLLMIHAGHWVRPAPHDPITSAAVAPIISTVLSLIGLVLAFSFSNASNRLDASRSTILGEVNALETAWNRIDLAEPEAQPRLRDLLRSYVDSRIRAYEAFEIRAGSDAYEQEVRVGAGLLREIWASAVPATPPNPNRTLLLTALGLVGDAATARRLALGTHLPPAVFMFLIGIVLVGALLVGTSLSGTPPRLTTYRIVFALVLSSTIYAILDMEYPRVGGFRLLRKADALLVELRQSMS